MTKNYNDGAIRKWKNFDDANCVERPLPEFKVKNIKSNTHRRRRRDSTVKSRRVGVGVGGVNRIRN